MALKLKEDPREWRKFALALSVALWLVIGLFGYRATVSRSTALTLSVGVALWAIVAVLQPGWVRPVYRLLMTGGYYVGQGVGRVLLALVFVLVVTPLGIGLRILGKDLLQLKRAPDAKSYWRPARVQHRFDRQF